MSAHKVLLALVFIVFLAQACAPSSPVISSPLEGWEDAPGTRASILQAAPTPRSPQRGLEQEEEKAPQQSTGQKVETAFADIIGFPFRAAAWLAHTLL